jgi:hypothetical protein
MTQSEIGCDKDDVIKRLCYDFKEYIWLFPVTTWLKSCHMCFSWLIFKRYWILRFYFEYSRDNLTGYSARLKKTKCVHWWNYSSVHNINEDIRFSSKLLHAHRLFCTAKDDLILLRD